MLKKQLMKFLNKSQPVTLTLESGCCNLTGYVLNVNDDHVVLLASNTDNSITCKDKIISKAKNYYKSIPLVFIKNQGQIDSSVNFYAQKGNKGIYFNKNKAMFTFIKASKQINKHFKDINSISDRLSSQATQNASKVTLALHFLNSNPQVEIKGDIEAEGKVNYFIGNDPSKWLSHLSTYEKVRYQELWSGIDLCFQDLNGELKYEFLLKPGANVNDIRLKYEGAKKLSLDEKGNLIIKHELAVLKDSKPISYQIINGEKKLIKCSYRLFSEKNSNAYCFSIEDEYDSSLPLIIDPGLDYSTYLGGSFTDLGYGIAVDNSESAYVTGFTGSSNFPTTEGAYGPNVGGSVFISKISPDGSSLEYSTYLGGNGSEEGLEIAVDNLGSAYVTGLTYSTNFPTTAGAFDTSYNGSSDAFVTKISPDGSNLDYSTYLGGSGQDYGYGIAVDDSGSAYVTGFTVSIDFPTTAGSFDTSYNGSFDAFVTKISPDGSSLEYSTYLGESNRDYGLGISVDNLGSAYITGFTYSTNFPTTAGAFDTTFNGSFDAFVTKLSPDGSSLDYSTYLVGIAPDQGWRIAVDKSGSAYVTGYTRSTDFPTTADAFDTSFNGDYDAFVSKISPSGSKLEYSTYLGGSNYDEGFGIAVDSSGSAYITGYTRSSDFPTTAEAFDNTINGDYDAFVSKISPSGSSLDYSTYLGGSESDQGSGIAVDNSGNAYVTGNTFSSNFPTTAGAFDTDYNDLGDVFVTKFNKIAAVTPTIYRKYYIRLDCITSIHFPGVES
ncbi:DUF7948 domain-containing protein [Natronospora cellulosivora (SeqCode)]